MDAVPRMNIRLNRLLPMTLPSASCGFFLLAAMTAVTSSGNEVPTATIVMAMTASLMPQALARFLALSRNKFPPKMNLVVNILTNICLFLFVMLICVKGGYRYTVGQVKQIDAALHISKSIMYASVPFTGVITMYYAVYNTIRDVLNYKEGKRKLSDPLGGTA